MCPDQSCFALHCQLTQYTHISPDHRNINAKVCFVVPADCRTLDWFASLWQLKPGAKLSPVKLNQLFLSSLHGATPNGRGDQTRSVETAPTSSLSPSSFLPLSLSLWTLAVVCVFSCAVWVWSFTVFSAPLGSPFRSCVWRVSWAPCSSSCFSGESY